jgi:hypothetical protein
MKEVYAYCRTIYTIVSSKNIRKTFGFNRYGMVHGIFARLQIFETKTSPHIHLPYNEKSVIERTIQYFKDRLKVLMIIFIVEMKEEYVN